jgi:hypothetical protein
MRVVKITHPLGSVHMRFIIMGKKVEEFAKVGFQLEKLQN